MSFFQGQHVQARFAGGSPVEVIILELRDDEALVQEKGTQRAEWILLRRISR